jgi:serine/threonine protein kinase
VFSFTGPLKAALSISLTKQSANIGLGGRPGRAKLLDYGLAKSMEGKAAADERTTMLLGPRTITGLAGGTKPYMPPEARADPKHKFSAQTEVFSLGMVLLELMSGRLITYSTELEVQRATRRNVKPEGLMAWMDDAVEWPESLREPLLQLVNDCLQYFPDERPRRMHAVLTRLQELRDAAVKHRWCLYLAYSD